MPVCTPGQQKGATVALTVGVTWLMSVKAGPKCGHDLRSGTNPASLADLLLVLTDLLLVLGAAGPGQNGNSEGTG